LEKANLLPPLSKPGKILCVGLNYHAHAKEFSNLDTVKYPEIFARFSTCLVGHKGRVVKPSLSDQLDFEGELAVVIGKAGRSIPKSKALEHVAGYSIFNDVTVRDFQKRVGQWTMGKNFDTTGPFGPWMATPDELPPGGAGLRISTRLNGQVMQDSNTDCLIFDVPTLIEYVSSAMTLLPGDFIATGTPGGIGAARSPQVFMKAGDLVEVEIERLGILSNPVVLDPGLS
jgi:2-keto-4-pentenoate hydratase/2-oxohepta-3-ene-1,7-dioic acid hydratase in catechol pathway